MSESDTLSDDCCCRARRPRYLYVVLGYWELRGYNIHRVDADAFDPTPSPRWSSVSTGAKHGRRIMYPQGQRWACPRRGDKSSDNPLCTFANSQPAVVRHSPAPGLRPSLRPSKPQLSVLQIYYKKNWLPEFTFLKTVNV